MRDKQDWSWKPPAHEGKYLFLGKPAKKPKKRKGKWKDPESKDFYNSWEWLKLRFEVLKAYGAVCMLCGDTGHIVVDHIKSRAKHPKLALDFDNMQVLCNRCNKGKGRHDETDFRSKLPEPELSGPEREHFKSI